MCLINKICTCYADQADLELNRALPPLAAQVLGLQASAILLTDIPRSLSPGQF